jgi:hypothetical protein
MWRYRDRRGSATLWVLYVAGGSVDEIRSSGTGAPFIDPANFAALYASPGSRLEDIAGGRGVAQDYDGLLGEQTLGGRAFSVPVSGGAISVIAYGPASESASLRSRVDLLSVAVKDASP